MVWISSLDALVSKIEHTQDGPPEMYHFSQGPNKDVDVHYEGSFHAGVHYRAPYSTA